MKRIPIIRSLWHPMSRVMKPTASREVYHIMIGTEVAAYCARGLLTIPGIGSYRPS